MPPPENTPNETRPSTPPTAPAPYLEQLEQAIATPVPDLAATLSTPDSPSLNVSSRSPTVRRISTEAWAASHFVAPAYNHRSDSRSPMSSSRRNTGSDLAESRDRSQSEQDRWRRERDRLRTFLNNQQNRQLALEEQNTRLRREHSRLAEENSRLYSTAAHVMPQDTIDAGTGDTLSNLATAIAEVGRENYSTRGSGPSRQRLYDWAAHHSPEPQDSTLSSMSRDPLSARHRELEHALLSYRSARNNFRSERPSSDLGTVPTAAALRAYWTEDDSPNETSQSRALPPWAERYRRDRQHRPSDRTLDGIMRRMPGSECEPSKSGSLSDANTLKDRIRNAIRYLSKLRSASADEALPLARFMDLDVLYECQDSNAPSSLPLLRDNLPKSEPSSWLAPGMTWDGIQSTDRDSRSNPPLTSSSSRVVRQREYFGRSTTRRGIIAAQNAATSMMGDPRLADIDAMDSDRYLSSLMRDPEGRWGFGQSRDLGRSSTADTAFPSTLRGYEPSRSRDLEELAVPAYTTDQWPVTVTLHTVDRKNMLVTGTMRASQIPDNSGNGKSMESYFHGEIIDFRNHSLETDSRRGYKVGGLDVDARYWSRIGPFKEAIQKQASSTYWDSSTWEDRLKTGDAKYWEMLKSEEQSYRELEADRVMMRCLGNQKWLQEKLGEEWILMRWKEKCFVDPILQSHSSAAKEDSISSPSNSSQMTWGLTISGFYYVALHRQSGRIDALYYDPGSQPYQSLKMTPEGNEPSLDRQIPEKEVPDHMSGGPVKKWFPSIDFR